MFCGKCGRKLEEGEVFCPGCGTPVQGEKSRSVETKASESPIQSVGEQILGGNITEKNQSTLSYYWKYAGILSGIIAFISLFLTWVKTAYGLDSRSYMEFMDVQEFSFIRIVAIVSILLVILLQLLNKPKLSLIGCGGMVVCILFFMYGMAYIIDAHGKVVDYGFGFFLYLLMMILTIVAAYKVNKKK